VARSFLIDYFHQIPSGGRGNATFGSKIGGSDQVLVKGGLRKISPVAKKESLLRDRF